MCIGKRRFLGNPLARRIPPAILALFILIAISSVPGNQVGARGRAEGSFFRPPRFACENVCVSGRRPEIWTMGKSTVWRPLFSDYRFSYRRHSRSEPKGLPPPTSKSRPIGVHPEIWTMGKSVVWRPLFSDYRFSYRRHSRADAAKHRRFHGQNRPA